MKIIFPRNIYRASNFNCDFTYTYKDEGIDLSQLNTDVILDVNGAFYEKNSFTDTVNMLIVGGIDKYINSKIVSSPYPFYITMRQKQSLYNLFRIASVSAVDKNISSPNTILRQFLSSLYLNFRG